MAARFEKIKLDEGSGRIWMPEGMQIDLGGIAKGWTAGRAAQILKEGTTACGVSAGGDMVLIGLPEGQDQWEVALEDPRDPDLTLALLHVGPGAVATSSVVKRSWRQGEKQRHHLIDPRSGEPAVSDWLSVTVIAPTGTDAEVYAKVLLIAGSRLAQKIVSGNPKLSFIAVDRQGKLWGSQKSMEHVYVNA
jgi:thiamine biosynthesis lipoprotein